MKNSWILIVSLAMLTACKSNITGCMDPSASNYDPLANRYGQCTYDNDSSGTTPPPVNTPDYGVVKMTFVPYANGKPFDLNKNYKDLKNRNFLFSTFKFYVSDIKLVADAIKKNVSQVELIDFDTSAGISPSDPRWYPYFWADSVEAGEFQDIYLGFGVDPELNEEYRNTAYPADHPLNTSYNDMGWGWRDKYIFTQVEGQLDTDSNGVYDKSIFWHTGLSDLYRFQIIDAPGVRVENGHTTFVNLKLHVDTLWLGIDAAGAQGTSHTGNPADKITSSIFQTNLSRAVELEGITYE